MKEKAKLKDKAQNKVHKATSRKRLELQETYEEREERLRKKRKDAKELRDLQIKHNSEEVRKQEKHSKRTSRSKQLEADPNYERPRYKEKISLLPAEEVLDKWQKIGRKQATSTYVPWTPQKNEKIGRAHV